MARNFKGIDSLLKVRAVFEGATPALAQKWSQPALSPGGSMAVSVPYRACAGLRQP